MKNLKTQAQRLQQALQPLTSTTLKLKDNDLTGDGFIITVKKTSAVHIFALVGSFGMIACCETLASGFVSGKYQSKSQVVKDVQTYLSQPAKRQFSL